MSLPFCFNKFLLLASRQQNCSAVETETISEHKQVLKLVMEYLSYDDISKMASQKWLKNPIIQKKFLNMKNMKHQH